MGENKCREAFQPLPQNVLPAMPVILVNRSARFKTIQKYTHALHSLMRWLDGRPLTKQTLLEWKEELTCTHAATSVNTTVAAINGYLNFWKWGSMRLRPLRLQRTLFYSEDKELTKMSIPDWSMLLSDRGIIGFPW